MNGRLAFSSSDVVDISALVSWCQLLGRGGWHEFRTAVSYIDDGLDPFDVARAMVIDCVIDVDFDGNWCWSSPGPSFVVGVNGKTWILGASAAYRGRLARSYVTIDIDESFLTVGIRRTAYRYAALRSVDGPIDGSEGACVQSHVAPWSLLRSLPSISKIVAAAEEIDMPGAGRAAEKFVVSCDEMTFDAVPQSKYEPAGFNADCGDPALWRFPSSKTILIAAGRAYRIHDDVGRLHVILDGVRKAGRQLQFDWYSMLDAGELADVVAIPRVRMPMMYRRALRVAGATYPPFSDAGRLWAVGVDSNLARELAGKLGMMFRKVD